MTKKTIKNSSGKSNKILRILFPALNLRYLLRIVIVAIVAYIVFSRLLIPFRIDGKSMEPTYRDGGFNFCFTPAFWFTSPERQDVVVIRFAGKRVMLLKRVVALAGETVAFENGRLLVDGEKLEEPYVLRYQDWDLPPRTVEEGNVYVIGDNRNVSMKTHYFGQTSIGRIEGAPLW
jgi:signal peptidase I